MKHSAIYSHNHGVNLWQERNLHDWAINVFDAPKIKIGNVSTAMIRDHVKLELEKVGWAFNVKIDAETDLSVFARKDDLAFQLQTGNISRYAYDLLKLQHLYSKRSIESAILAIPTKDAALKVGSNIANVDRVWNELGVFNRFITIPIMLIAFE